MELQKHFKLKTLGSVLALLILLGSCKSAGIKWRPEWYSVSSTEQLFIYCPAQPDLPCTEVVIDTESETKFQCLHNDKVLELREILKRAKIPQNYKKKALLLLPNDLGPSTFRGPN